MVSLATAFAWPAAAAPAASTQRVTSTDVAPGSPGAQVSDSSAADQGLQATSAPAWVPDHPVPSQEPWEFALRAPERIATLPLSVLGHVAKYGLRYIEQNQLLTRFSGPSTKFHKPPVGFSVGAAHLGPKVGLGLAARFNYPVLGNDVSAELSGSTQKYTRTKVALAHGPAKVHFEYDWRPRDRFFGYGIASSEDSSSSFAWRQQRFQLTLTYPWRQTDGKRPPAQVSGWVGPREEIMRRGRLDPSFEKLFAGQAGLLDQHEEHFVYGLQLERDTRTGSPHWGHGYLAGFRAERFDKAIDQLTIRSRHADAPQYTRLSFHGQTGFSFMRDPRTIRLTVRAVGTRSVSGNAPFLIPDLVSLGADDGLGSFDLGRFRDRELAYGALAYIFPLSRHLEMETHAETGGVYPHLRDAKISALKQSYGFSVRVRTDSAILASVGADWSPGIFVIRYNLWSGE